MHATAFLKATQPAEVAPVIVLHGTEQFLKHSVLLKLREAVLGGTSDEDIGPSQFTGKNAELVAVCDELLTVSMWSDRRMVVVEDADEFVSQNRAGLEKFLEKPSKKSVLVLLVKSWPKNTRLAKRVAKIGMDVQCTELGASELNRWLADIASEKYGKQLPRASAALMIELAGVDLGLLEQELAKLAA